MMVKDAITQKAWLSASVTFWMSLLVSSVIVHCPLQARADQVPGKEAIAKVPPSAPSVEAPTDVAAFSVTDQTLSELNFRDNSSSPLKWTGSHVEIAEQSSDKADINPNPVQDTVSTAAPTISQANPVESSPDIATLEVPSV